MMRSQPEPLNFKLARVTPKWAFKQSSRRALVIALALVSLGLIFAAWLSSLDQLISIAVLLSLVGYVAILSLVFSLLFPIVLFLTTCVLAWTQPDPLEEV